MGPPVIPQRSSKNIWRLLWQHFLQARCLHPTSSQHTEGNPSKSVIWVRPTSKHAGSEYCTQL